MIAPPPATIIRIIARPALLAGLLVLQAGVLQRSNDLDGAVASLRRARVLAPADPLVALDLAILLRQRGDAAATALFTEASRSRDRALAERARRELGATPERRPRVRTHARRSPGLR